jgi:hypothetical protein
MASMKILQQQRFKVLNVQNNNNNNNNDDNSNNNL